MSTGGAPPKRQEKSRVFGSTRVTGLIKPASVRGVRSPTVDDEPGDAPKPILALADRHY
jgi:hypothetical protein